MRSMLDTVWNYISWGLWYLLIGGIGWLVIDMFKHPKDWFD
nr:MAG TPA: Selenoprotein S (SelS) [Caudoviricetes sp.]